MKLLLSALLAGSAAAFAPSAKQARSSVAVQESISDLETLGKKLNPVIGFFDPLDLAGKNLWDTTDAETIGFLRESEVKVRFFSADRVWL